MYRGSGLKAIREPWGCCRSDAMAISPGHFKKSCFRSVDSGNSHSLGSTRTRRTDSRVLLSRSGCSDRRVESGMIKSGQLRLEDIRAVFRLLGDFRELGQDPLAWNAILTSGLAQLFGAVMVNTFSAEHTPDLLVVNPIILGMHWGPTHPREVGGFASSNWKATAPCRACNASQNGTRP